MKAILKLLDQLNQPHSWLRYNDVSLQVQEVMQAIPIISFPSDLPEKIVDRDHLRQNLEELCRGSEHKAFFDEFIGLIPVQYRFSYEYVFFNQERIKSCDASRASAQENLKRCINRAEFEIAESAVPFDDGDHPSGSQPIKQVAPNDPDARLECASHYMGYIFSAAELQAAMILGFCAASTNLVANHRCTADKAFLHNAQIYFKKLQDPEVSARFARAVADSAKQQTSEAPIHSDGPVLQKFASQNFDLRLEQCNKVYSDFQTWMSTADSLIRLLKTLEKESVVSEAEPASYCCYGLI